MRTLCRHTLAHIELQLPPPPVAGHAPQLQHAGLGDDGFERYGDDVGGVLLGGEVDLYLVATPIGNLGDITLRALDVLKRVDRIACEDTRQTQKLLNHFEISTPTLSCHQHNEHQRASELIGALKAGGRIAVVSDAGMPGISDPGSWLTAEAIASGVAVIPIPGANAALSALVASGLPTDAFHFIGFLPEKAGARRTRLEALAAEMQRSEAARTLIFYEAPHRIMEMLADREGNSPRP